MGPVHAHGHDMLGKNIEHIGGHVCGLYLTPLHPVCDYRTLQQIAFEFGIDPPYTDLTHPVSCPAHALKSSGNGAGRLNEYDAINSAHVNAQLKGACGDNSAYTPGLQSFFYLRTFFVRYTSMMGKDQLFISQIIDALCQAFT